MIKQIINDRILKDIIRFDKIQPERKDMLDNLAEVIVKSLETEGQCKITVICTHNSRRSQLGQVLFQLAAEYYGIKGMEMYSGGTEETAFNHRMIEALERFGFDIVKTNESDNPEYNISWGTGGLKDMKSRTYFDKYNPQTGFIALLVCGSAEKDCPVVIGALQRIGITYEDPKTYDDTEREPNAYDEKIVEMGIEIFYTMNKVSKSR